ncbi:hypothetical protein JNW90_26390 [Micromonospora sp. STR1s_5]|nr:hypothetical protein [Micromonospora sp. STR1s_5]
MAGPGAGGDRLAVRVDVMGARPSTARPGLGTVSLTGTMLRLGPDDRPEQEVLRTRFRGWFAVRPAEADPAEAEAAPTAADQPRVDQPGADQPDRGPTATDPSTVGSSDGDPTESSGSPEAQRPD